jgi:hypothetical protein
MPSYTHQTTGYKTEEFRYPYRWMALKPEVFSAVERGPLTAEEIISHTITEVERTTHKRLGLQLPPNFHRNPYIRDCPSLQEDLEHKTKIADEMLRSYFEEGEGRGLNIRRKPKKSYFDMGSIKKDTFSDKFIIENDHDYFSSFKEEYNKRTSWNYTPYQPKEESFIRSMEYDPTSGRIDIDLETCHFTYSDYPYMASPANLVAIVDLKKNQIRNNLTIIVKSRANPICNVPKNELAAIETLREMITETEFRKYIKHGFILVRGLSGRVYQIFRNKEHTKVWEKGKLVEEVCVRIKRNLKVPPTDNVIAFRTMVLCDEGEFKKLGNVYKMAA